MRSLSIREAPRPGVTGVFPQALQRRCMLPDTVPEIIRASPSSRLLIRVGKCGAYEVKQAQMRLQGDVDATCVQFGSGGGGKIFS